jgi:hypothetical protein
MRRFLLAASFLLLSSRSFAAIYSVGLATANYTSDFMMGKVVCAIVFPESNGSLDPNTETWTDARKSQAISEIMAGHQWWTKQNPRSSVSFTYVVQTLATKYEPISRPYFHEQYWIPDALSKIGYSGTRFTASKNYINDLRAQYQADWGFIIFVVDSANDYNGKFSDGYFAYAYLGGPFIVMTYDNGGYGITNMDVVAAHETGHIFHALDEYVGGSSPNDYSFGYFPTINGNHEWSTIANDPNSIMRGGLRWGLDDWARLMLGWRDSNNNNVDDILDQQPEVVLSPQTLSSGPGQTVMQGHAKINVLPRQGNTSGYGMTLDTIAKVEYRYGSDGDWMEASAVDGSFNSPEETFQIDVPQSAALNIQSASPFNPASINLEVRAKTAYTMNAGNGTGPQVMSVGALNNAHPYPNPFKPNSSLNHTSVTFTGLTTGSKLNIFTPTGEPVYDATSPVGSDLTWPGVDADGKNVSSGVYLYLITDAAGNKKQGKLAVIR